MGWNKIRKTIIKNYREIILSEAKDIAMKEGISNINISCCCLRIVGIAIGTVYNYFPSKGDLLVAIIEDFWEGAFCECWLARSLLQ